MSAYYGSVAYADKQLRVAILVLQGKGYARTWTWKSRLHFALIIRDRLRTLGYQWHAARVENWIHRCQPKTPAPVDFSVQLGDAELTLQKEEGGDSF